MLILLLSCMSAKVQRLEKNVQDLQQQNTQLEERVRELEKTTAEYESLMKLLKLGFDRVIREGKQGTEEAREQGKTFLKPRSQPEEWPEKIADWSKNASRNQVEVSPEDQALLRQTEYTKKIRMFQHQSPEGFVDGFRLSGIRRDSVFYRIQFKNGDIIMAYNGKPLTNLPALMNITQTWNEKNHVFLVKRRNQFLVLELIFR
ncbi:MAG: hypothetical protein VX278_22645 [Myxococcota bacterium]|nr:hypothetical protein [Myxococcota bacterium]